MLGCVGVSRSLCVPYKEGESRSSGKCGWWATFIDGLPVVVVVQQGWLLFCRPSALCLTTHTPGLSSYLPYTLLHVHTHTLSLLAPAPSAPLPKPTHINNKNTNSIYTSQSGWTIPDHMLRGAVKRVIKDDLLGTYQDFLRRWGCGVSTCVVDVCACVVQ